MTGIPKAMKGVASVEPGPADSLTASEHPMPVPKAGEVLIRVAFAGVCRPDIMQRNGVFPRPPGSTDILGLEVAGEICAVGDGVDPAEIGRNVAALLPAGGYAEYAVADLRLCLVVPDGLSLKDAAALPEAVFTVWHNLFELGRLRPGEVALIHGGASGIGTTAIQLATATGARVLCTVGSADKVKAVEALGCGRAVVHRTEDFVGAAKAFTGGRGVDVVLDIVGGSYIERNFDALGQGGRHVSIAFMEGPMVPVDLRTIMAKGLVVTASTLRPKPLAEKARLAGAVRNHVWPLVETRKVRPVLHAEFPLDDAAGAHKLLESSSHVGKVVLRCAG